MKKFFLSTSNKATQDLGLLILRLGVGFLMIPKHGWVKLMNFESIQGGFVSFLGMSSSVSLGLTIFAEFFCSLFIMFGFFTRLACIPLIICTLVIFSVHDWNFLGKQELVTMFMIGYISILLLGPGKYSLDRMLFKK